MEKAAEAAQVDIPQGMIRTETDNMLRDFEMRIRQQGLNLDMYYQFTGQSEEMLREQMRPDAEKRVRNFLVLEAIAKAENLTVSDEEFDEELSKMAEMYQRTPDELRAIFSANGYLDDIRSDLLTRKSVQFLVDNSKTASEVA